MTSLSKWQLVKNYVLSLALACALVAVGMRCHIVEPFKSIRDNILLILIALFAITMPAIGSLCTKIIELKKVYSGITLLPMNEVNKALYEQTIPIFVTPFLVMLFDYIENNMVGEFYLWVIDALLLTFLFHSIFVIFDIFRAFIIIAGAVSEALDKLKQFDISDE